MRRLLLAGLMLAAAPGVARAQWTAQFHEATDSAIGLVPGSSRVIPIFITPNGTNFIRARMTFHYDPALMAIEAVAVTNFTGLWQAVDTVRGPGTFTVGAGASFFYSGFLPERMFGLRVRLLPGADNGTFIHARIDSLQTQFNGNAPNLAYSHVGQVCHATSMFGDVDASQDVDSRDALIVLSASIGLPAAGFDLPLGDVDRDGLTTSRDALFMLSHTVGITAFGVNHRTGAGVPDACPPVTPLSERIVFVRRGVSAESLFTLAGGTTTPVYVPNTEGGFGQIRTPRLSTGNVAVYNCIRPANMMCRVNIDGTGFLEMLTSIQSTPDWSPGDSLILFEQVGQLRTSDPAGNGIITRTGVLALPSSPGQGYAFNRTGLVIAYPVTTSAARTIGLDGQNDVAVVSANVPRSDIVRWSPAGDSIAVAGGSISGMMLLPATGGLARQVSSFRVHTTSFQSFDWGSDGLLFALDQPGLRGIWVIPAAGGVPRRITRGNDMMPAFRRNP